MREIKFRAWMNDGNDQMRFIADYGGLDKLIFMAQKHEWPLMQFTGLKDKNGKEIYEGDVARYVDNDTVYEIIYKEHGFIANNNDKYVPGVLVFLDQVEIIGNKWENPELLS